MDARSRTSDSQFAALVEFMERNGDLGKPQAGAQGRLRADRLWQQLTDLLNSIGGGAQRTPDKWKKIWADWKSKTKTKARAIRQHAARTGGGPPSRKSLSALEERVAAILGETALSGQPGIQEQGLHILPEPNVEGSERGQNEDEPFFVDESSLPASALPEVNMPEASTATVAIERDREASPPLAVAGPSRASVRAQASTSSSAPRPRLAASPPSAASSPRRRRLPQPRLAASPPSVASSPRRRRRHLQPRQLASPRRPTRTQTPFERAAGEFAAVEMRRLELEHEREMRRIDVDREHNELLRRIIDIGQTLVETLINRGV